MIYVGGSPYVYLKGVKTTANKTDIMQKNTIIGKLIALRQLMREAMKIAGIEQKTAHKPSARDAIWVGNNSVMQTAQTCICKDPANLRMKKKMSSTIILALKQFEEQTLF